LSQQFSIISLFELSEDHLMLMGWIEIKLGDRVQMRKPHPCGGDLWTIYRVGADIGLQCLTCERRVMLARGDFNKRVKKVLSGSAPENSESEQ
jgi:hypothetical protein